MSDIQMTLLVILAMLSGARQRHHKTYQIWIQNNFFFFPENCTFICVSGVSESLKSFSLLTSATIAELQGLCICAFWCHPHYTCTKINRDLLPREQCQLAEGVLWQPAKIMKGKGRWWKAVGYRALDGQRPADRQEHGPWGSPGRSGLLSPGDFDSRKLVLFPVCQISKDLRLHVAGSYHPRGYLREEGRSIWVCKIHFVFSSHWCTETTALTAA